MTSSGDKGMVILSLGTWLHGAMSLEHWNKIAAGLAMVPQKVIWKYTGLYPPARLGNNTKLVPWLPQNDLLGKSMCVFDHAFHVHNLPCIRQC